MEPNISPPHTPAKTARNDMRTMKTDIAEAIKEQDETLVSIALAEKKQQEKMAQREEIARAEGAQALTQGEYEAPKRRGRVFLVVTIFLFIILVLAAGWISFKFLLPRLSAVKLPSFSIPNFNPPKAEPSLPIVAEEPVIVLAPSLIPAQSEKRLDTSKDNPDHIFALITVERTAGLNIGDIKNLYFTEESSPQEGAPLETTSLSAVKFLTFAKVSAPEMLIRSLEDSFMAGLFGEESGTTPFIILKVSSYETGLAGMLAWEKDILSLFTTVFGTKTETETIKKSAFHTIVVLGRDARSFGADPRQSIAYAFADANTIIIAGSQNTLGKIMLRVAGK